MQVIENELIVAIDMDDTLGMWDSPTIPGPTKVAVEFAGKTVYLTPHQYHVDLVKMYKERGYFIIGWSANGKRHVERVVAALGLTDYFDLAMTKLTKHVDDSEDAGSILGPRVYCPDFTKPKELPVMTRTYDYKGIEIPKDSVAGGMDSGGSFYITRDNVKIYNNTAVLGGVLNGR